MGKMNYGEPKNGENKKVDNCKTTINYYHVWLIAKYELKNFLNELTTFKKIQSSLKKKSFLTAHMWLWDLQCNFCINMHWNVRGLNPIDW